ncbi:2-keto-3-deoxygluconate permease [Oceanobacillus sojae]|uniref:2-keto-3-deoxygluconate permease n=1 Tax=Oceanobacillus sojae TaxID=582851 RepID=A0A511ZK06_9BACI|nr:2-keto-3-deoxygluconate permease [Oceanobacillus sojae]GEN87791.1 2-keto-3-deoxygluconate permease [Oceanobacillus sojae]
MEIKRFLERIPGGMMVVPLLLGAIVNTVAPNALRIDGFTQALFVDAVPVLAALYLVCAGAQLNLRSFGTSVAKGVTLLTVKWFVAVIFTLLAIWFGGESGLWLGLAPLAIMAAMSNSNGAMYMAVASQYGKQDDKAAYSILVLNDGPLLTMLAFTILGFMGFVEGMFSIMPFISVLIPLLVGVVLGNLDGKMRDFFVSGSDMIIPFLAFALGMGIDLTAILEGGLSGVLLGVFTLIFTGGAAFFVFKLFKWNPIVGAAEGTTAGNAVMVPAVIAAANPAFASVEAVSTVQVAASAVTTAILLPIALSLLVKLTGAQKNTLTENVTSNDITSEKVN